MGLSRQNSVISLQRLNEWAGFAIMKMQFNETDRFQKRKLDRLIFCKAIKRIALRGYSNRCHRL